MTRAEAPSDDSSDDRSPRTPPAAREAQPHVVHVSATFTADPLQEILDFWLHELGIEGHTTLGDYNQVFQDLLDPGRGIAALDRGVGLVLVRLCDWLRFVAEAEAGAGPQGEGADPVLRNARELVDALKAAASRARVPIVFGVLPDTPGPATDEARFAKIRARMLDDLAGHPNLYMLGPDDQARYPVETVFDPERDALGHIPFTPEYYAALGTALARKIHALLRPPAKVAVLDCDNTLWRGVVGEDGPMGVGIDGGYAAMQSFMAQLQTKGTVLALNSKNVEADVLEVFDKRPQMPLRLEHIVAWRINWTGKAQNLGSLAAELNVGIDSFVFLDDNPVECAEARAAHPQVTTLHVPPEPDIERFVQHLWPLDVLRVTAEDEKRTELYKQAAQRTKFESDVTDISSFIAGLDLEIDIGAPSDAQIPRVAQLTQRTNQFNLTTVRRTEPQVRALPQEGMEVLRCTVKDRFGDYGLVGVMIYGLTGEALVLDSMMLSCRVLGRGVEHAMLKHLGEVAVAAGKARVDVPFSPTKKNLPARNFVESLGGDHREAQDDGRAIYRMPAPLAAAASYSTGYAQEQLEIAKVRKVKKGADDGATGPSKSERYQRIATELTTARAVLAAVHEAATAARPDGVGELVAPRTTTERALCEVWSGLLHLSEVGVRDGFYDLGGTSLQAASLFAEIDRRWRVKLPLTTILQDKTIEALARRIDPDAAAAEGPGDATGPRSLVPLRQGEGAPPLFFVHDGLGETLLYHGLAQRLPAGVAVYGIEPTRSTFAAMVHTSVEDMASDYVARIRQVQPRGPWRLAGMCAGGVIAFECARQLSRDGGDVDFLGIMEAGAPGASPTGADESEMKGRFLGVLGELDPKAPLRSLAHVAAGMSSKATNYARWRIRSGLRQAEVEARLRVAREVQSRVGVDASRALAGLTVQEIYERAVLDYDPPAWPGHACVIVATEGEGSDRPHRELFAETDLGWQRLCEGGIEMVEVPGGHASLLQVPHVEALAQQVTSRLGRPEAESLADAEAPTDAER